MRCRAERACLRILEGGCSVPVGVQSTFDPSEMNANVGKLELTSTVTSLSGEFQVVESMWFESACGFEDAERLGEDVARALIDSGAASILEEVNVKRAEKQERDAEKAKAKEMETTSSSSASTPTTRVLPHVDSFLNQLPSKVDATTNPFDGSSSPSRSSLFSFMSFFSLSFSTSSSAPAVGVETSRQFPGAWPNVEDL